MRPLATGTLTMAALWAGPTGLYAQNELILNNGPEITYFINEPSDGSPVGTFPPDWDGELFWKTFPGQTLRAADGDLSLRGVRVILQDSNWATSPSYYDFFLSAGLPSSALIGGVEPNPADPNGIFVSIGDSGLPDPCALPGNPFGCVDGCPSVAGCSDETLAYEVEITFGTPITLDASSFPPDGSTDLTVTYFVPGGMLFGSGPFTGCSFGDYVFQYTVSDNALFCPPTGEKAAEVPGTDTGPFGGFNFGGGYTPFPDLLVTTTWAPLIFDDPILNARPDPSALLPPETGTAGVLLSVGDGDASLGVEIHAQDHVGQLVACAGSVQPLLARPGVSFLGANLLLFPDSFALAIADVWSGGVPPSGIYQSPQIAIPASAAGFDLHLQGVLIDPSALVAEETNVWTVSLLQ
ncbi:MAG: hypothetical protein AAF682_04290 [Planctomycetota bacterium]